MERQKVSRIDYTKSKSFAMLYKWVLYSPEFIKLPNYARMAYILLKMNLPSIYETVAKCPYIDAELFMNRHTWSKAVKVLIEKGFIAIYEQGGLLHNCTQYKLLPPWFIPNKKKEKKSRKK